MWRLSEQLDRADPKWAPGRRARVESLQAFTVGDARGWMLLLLGAVVLVLLIACANVANLMLARATVRAREMSIRAAIGATPWRLMRAQLVEGLVLALAATAVGIALAVAATGIIRAWLPANVPRVSTIQIDARVLGVAVLAALVTGVAFAMAPAWFGVRSDLVESLKDGGRSATAGRRGRRLRSLLVVGEIAIAVMLVAGAGLFTGSFIQLMRVDPGFDYHNVLTLDVWLPRERGETFDRAAYAERSRRYDERILEAVAHAPGVEEVATVQGGVPLTGSWSRGKVTLPGRGELTGEGDDIDIRRVTPNYLHLMRIPLIKGRYLTRDDRANAPLVLVINQAAAARYWPGQDALGRQVTIGDNTFTVVGIVGNVHHLGPEIAPRQECYISTAQGESYGGSLVIRTAGDPMAALPAVKAAIWSVNPEERLTGETVTLEGYMDRLIAQRRFNMAVLALFGLLGLVIAAVGVYAVMAYLVAQRTNEIGVRMALGATRGNVLALVLRGAAVLTGAGLAIGGVAAWYLSAGLQTFLFRIRPADLRILGGAVATLALAALAATAIPARRAAGVDPLVALRRE
jgi:predicted permease